VDDARFNTSLAASRLRVVVPADFEHAAIPVPVTRNDTRASCIACIAADSHALKRLIVIPGKTLEMELWECDHAFDTCHIRMQEHRFLTTDLIADRANPVFFPDMIQSHQSLGCAGPMALIFDGFACEVSLQNFRRFITRFTGVHSRL
jgi:hypothetical protein